MAGPFWCLEHLSKLLRVLHVAGFTIWLPMLNEVGFQHVLRFCLPEVSAVPRKHVIAFDSLSLCKMSRCLRRASCVDIDPLQLQGATIHVRMFKWWLYIAVIMWNDLVKGQNVHYTRVQDTLVQYLGTSCLYSWTLFRYGLLVPVTSPNLVLT